MGDSVTPSEFRTAVAAAARNTAAAQTAIAAQSTQIERLLSVVESITKSSTGAGTPFANFASPHAPNHCQNLVFPGPTSETQSKISIKCHTVPGN